MPLLLLASELWRAHTLCHCSHYYTVAVSGWWCWVMLSALQAVHSSQVMLMWVLRSFD
jgi:hypothetical protein